MKRRKLLFSLLSVCVCLCVVGSSILTASAAGTQAYLNPETYQLDSVEVMPNGSDSWTEETDYTYTKLTTGAGQLAIHFTHGWAKLWRANFTPLSAAGNLTVTPYMQFNANIIYMMDAGSNFSGQTITGAMYLTSPSGTIYEFPITDQYEFTTDNEYEIGYFIEVGGSIEVGEGFDTGDCSIMFQFSGISNLGGVTINFQTLSFHCQELIGEETAKVVETVEQGFADLMEQQNQNTQDIIDNQNQNTQDIIDNQDSNTQDIIDNENQNAGKTHGFLQSILEGVLSIPQKIWELIENGLKSLFVPDQDYIVGYKDKWDTLLSSRFGAVYESSEILIDFAKSIKSADETDTVSIPKVTIPMPEDNEFSFGPYEVKVVPDATVLKFLVDTCKTITAVVSVFLLINALRKRWEEVMNVD